MELDLPLIEKAFLNSPLCPLFEQNISPILILGSGQTKPLPDWEVSSSIRFNIRTFYPIDYYPQYEVEGTVICRQFYSKFRKIKKTNLQLKNCLTLYVNSRTSGIEIFNSTLVQIGVKRDIQGNFHPDVHSFLFPFSIRNQTGKYHKFSTGFYSLFWLLSPYHREIYIAGFDGVLNKEYLQIDGQKWIGHHDLDQEWNFLSSLIDYQRSKGKKIIVSNSL